MFPSSYFKSSSMKSLNQHQILLSSEAPSLFIKHSVPSPSDSQGENVKIALLGGSISLRGWNSPDESYMSQVHRWLELVMVEGCR
jgi:hypothetical protein